MNKTIEIPLPEELLKMVDEKARRSGLDRDVYIRDLLARDLGGEPSITDILAQFRDQVASSGITDEELDRLFSEARDESYQERTRVKGQ
jgi:hypothetical protein